MEFSSAVKNNTIKFDGKWMSLISSFINEMGQTQKEKTVM